MNCFWIIWNKTYTLLESPYLISTGSFLSSGLALVYMNRGIKSVLSIQMTRNPYFPRVFLLGHWNQVARVRPIKSPRLNSKTTATGVKKFLVHCDFVMDSTEREIVIIIIIVLINSSEIRFLCLMILFSSETLQNLSYLKQKKPLNVY